MRALHRLGLPTSLRLDREKVLEAVQHDKKRTENGIAAVYVPEPGRFEFRNLTPGEIGDLLGIIEEA